MRLMPTKVYKIGSSNYAVVSNDKDLINKFKKAKKTKVGYLKIPDFVKNKIGNNSFSIFVLDEIEYEKLIGGTYGSDV